MNIVLVGGGKLVYFLAKQFERSGHDLTVIIRNADDARLLSRQLSATVIVGDGSDPRTLRETEIDRADVFLSLTFHDPDNLIACQIAQKYFEVPYTIALVNDPEHRDLFEQLGVTVAFSATQILGDLIEQQVDFEDIQKLIPVAEGRVSVTELVLPEDSPALGSSLQELNLPDGTLIGSIVRGTQVVVPRGGCRLQANDRLVLIGQPKNYAKSLRLLLGDRS